MFPACTIVLEEGEGVGVCARSPCNNRRSSRVFVLVRVFDLADFVGVIIFVVWCVWLVSLRRLYAWRVSLRRFSSLRERAALLEELGKGADALLGAEDGGEVDVYAHVA